MSIEYFQPLQYRQARGKETGMGMVPAKKKGAWPYKNLLQEFDPFWKPRNAFCEEGTPELSSEYKELT